MSSVLSLALASASIGCFLYGTTPSTAPLLPQGQNIFFIWSQRFSPKKSVKDKKQTKSYSGHTLSKPRFIGTMGVLSFPVRRRRRRKKITPDGCTVAFYHPVLMSLWVSSCHQEAQRKLLNLQSAELTPGVINQRLRRCEPRDVFLGSLLFFAHWSVNSPTLLTNHSHRETKTGTGRKGQLGWSAYHRACLRVRRPGVCSCRAWW